MFPPDHFARNLCRTFGITLRTTMELSNARAEVTPADFWEWARKIEAIIEANPDLEALLNAPNKLERTFNNVKNLFFNNSNSSYFS